MRVALVHESLVGYHGSERVLAQLAAMYPDAPIFCTLHHRAAMAGTPLADRDIRATWLDRLPGLRRRHRWLLPAMPSAIEQHDLRPFDLILSSHHAVAHGVLTRSDQWHLCYTHSPARYAWELYHAHLPPRRRTPVKRWLLHRFRQWDFAAGQRPDAFAANSRHIARCITKTYRRPAAVIHPPVEVDRFNADQPREDFYLVAGRLVAYKNVHLAVEACAPPAAVSWSWAMALIVAAWSNSLVMPPRPSACPPHSSNSSAASMTRPSAITSNAVAL